MPIYIIEYKSKKNLGEIKYTIIIPKKNTFNIFSNGFNSYLNKMIEKIKYKNGLIYSCLWFGWNTFFPDTKIIKL